MVGGEFVPLSKHLKGHSVPRVSHVTFLLKGRSGQPVSHVTFLLKGHSGQPVSHVTFLLKGHSVPHVSHVTFLCHMARVPKDRIFQWMGCMQYYLRLNFYLKQADGGRHSGPPLTP